MTITKCVSTLALCLALAGTGTAQTTLPYATGFDTPAEQTGWQLFRLGGFR